MSDQAQAGAWTGRAILTNLLPWSTFLHCLVQNNPGLLCAWLRASQFHCPDMELENMKHLAKPAQRLLAGLSSFALSPQPGCELEEGS